MINFTALPYLLARAGPSYSSTAHTNIGSPRQPLLAPIVFSYYCISVFLLYNRGNILISGILFSKILILTNFALQLLWQSEWLQHLSPARLVEVA